MAIQTKNTLKTYFETGDFPTQAQFADLIDSLLHVLGELPISQVTGLQAVLDGLAQAAPISGVAEASDVVVLADAQLVTSIVFWAAADAGFTLRYKNDSGTDQEVSLQAGVKKVINVQVYFEAAQYISIISPTSDINYAVNRSFI